MKTHHQETIAAIATPKGFGGVGILRISGHKAHDIALKLSRKQNLSTQKMPNRQMLFGSFYSSDLADKHALDSGLWVYFKAPHSFTGEDVIEFQGHGAPIVLDELIKQVILCGARLAKPGEFSLRAFLNDKIDLAQAEAISDLIHAQSVSSARLAMRSLQGDFSNRIQETNQQLVHLRMQVEAAIDFSDEDIDLADQAQITDAFETIHHALMEIIRGARQGALMRQSSVVVIIGPPNAGKSTLINALSGEQVAIVDNEAGTTRDVMRAHVLMDDMPIELVDTAGLRHSAHRVEQEGIRRAFDALQRADAILVVQDATLPNTSKLQLADLLADLGATERPEHVPVIHVFNKQDQLKAPVETQNQDNTMYISAKSGLGLEQLKDAIKAAMGHQPTEGLFLARRRHLDALTRGLQHLDSAKQQLFTMQQSDLFAEDLKLAHAALSEILGAFTSDDLLGEIFSSFCIGK